MKDSRRSPRPPDPSARPLELLKAPVQFTVVTQVQNRPPSLVPLGPGDPSRVMRRDCGYTESTQKNMDYGLKKEKSRKNGGFQKINM